MIPMTAQVTTLVTLMKMMKKSPIFLTITPTAATADTAVKKLPRNNGGRKIINNIPPKFPPPLPPLPLPHCFNLTQGWGLNDQGHFHPDLQVRHQWKQVSL